MTEWMSKYRIATFLAILFHVIGLTGLLFYDKNFFIASTPFNLLLMFMLLFWTQEEKNGAFILFLFLSILIGIAVEVIGVNTGALFGNYQYGDVLGIKWMKVPLMIGINWFITIYCCGMLVNMLIMKLVSGLPAQATSRSTSLRALSVVIDGATLAVFFDWLIEPVAEKLHYWHWKTGGAVPIFNYVSWFLVSVLLLMVFHLLKFKKQNKFAVNLLLVQIMFFMLLRTFMN